MLVQLYTVADHVLSCHSHVCRHVPWLPSFTHFYIPVLGSLVEEITWITITRVYTVFRE